MTYFEVTAVGVTVALFYSYLIQLDMRQLSSSSSDSEHESQDLPVQIVTDPPTNNTRLTQAILDSGVHHARMSAPPKRNSFKRKVIAGALGVGVLPSLIVGGMAAANYQNLIDQVAKQRPEQIEIAREQQSALYVGTGVIALLTGAIATLLAYRSLRPLQSVTSTTNRIVQQLNRGSLTSDLKTTQDEITHIESNLNFIAVQTLKLRSQKALEVNRPPTELNPQGSTQGLPDSVRTFIDISSPTVQDLSATAFQQTKSVDATYSNLLEISHSTQAVLSNVQQIIQQEQSVNKAAQVGQQTIEQIKEHHASMWVSLIEAATKVQNLSQPVQQLDQVLSDVGNITANIKLKAMNAALEAARIGEQGEEFANIGEDLHSLVGQLDNSITVVNTLTSTVRTEVQETTTKMTLGQQQASSGKLLITVAQQQLNQVSALTQQLKSLSEQAKQAVNLQGQSATDASQTMVEVATLTSQLTEQAALLSEALAQLPTLAQDV